MSETYIGKAGGVHPSYNAWEAPKTPSLYFESNRVAVERMLSSPGVAPNQANIVINYMGHKSTPAGPIRNNVNVIYFASGPINWVPNVPYVWADLLPDPGTHTIVQYFGEFAIQP